MYENVPGIWSGGEGFPKWEKKLDEYTGYESHGLNRGGYIYNVRETNFFGHIREQITWNSPSTVCNYDNAISGWPRFWSADYRYGDAQWNVDIPDNFGIDANGRYQYLQFDTQGQRFAYVPAIHIKLDYFPDEKDALRVHFESAGGTPTPAMQVVMPGDKVVEPTEPARDGYVFFGWYKSEYQSAWDNTSPWGAQLPGDFAIRGQGTMQLVHKWDFANDVVMEDTTLVALWFYIGDIDESRDGDVNHIVTFIQRRLTESIQTGPSGGSGGGGTPAPIVGPWGAGTGVNGADPVVEVIVTPATPPIGMPVYVAPVDGTRENPVGVNGVFYTNVCVMIDGVVMYSREEYITIVAENWVEHNVTFEDIFTGGVATTLMFRIHHGETVARPHDPGRAGYTFTAWYADEGRTVLFNFSLPITEPTQIWAGWEPVVAGPTTEHFTVWFVPNNGGLATAATVEAGQTVARPANPVREGGWVFQHWAVADAAGVVTAWDFDTPVTGNTLIFAVWDMIIVGELPPSPVTFMGDANMTIVYWVKNGETAPRPFNPGREGYNFAGWYYDDETFAVPFDFDMAIGGPVTVYAKWVELVPPDPVIVEIEKVIETIKEIKIPVTVVEKETIVEYVTTVIHEEIEKWITVSFADYMKIAGYDVEITSVVAPTEKAEGKVWFAVTVKYEDGLEAREVMSIRLAPLVAGTDPDDGGDKFNDKLLKRPNWIWLIIAICSMLVGGLVAVIVWLDNRQASKKGIARGIKRLEKKMQGVVDVVKARKKEKAQQSV